MLLIGLIYLWATGAAVHHWLLWAGVMTAIEVLVTAAVSLAFTALSSPLLSAVLSFATYAIGHAVASLPELMHHLKGWQQIVAVSLASLVPNLGMFTYRNQAVYENPIELSRLAFNAGYGLLWIMSLVTITVSVLRRKQL